MAKSIARNSGGRYIAIPHMVMKSEDYRGLSGTAVKLLNALMFQFNGQNNGDFTAAWTVMSKQHGFKSKDPLTRAIRELEKANLIIKTREGFFQNPGGRCALYAVTWLPINECKGKRLEMKSTITPPRKFSLEKISFPNPESGMGSQQIPVRKMMSLAQLLGRA